MFRRKKREQKKSWILLLLSIFGVKALIKKLGLDK